MDRRLFIKSSATASVAASSPFILRAASAAPRSVFEKIWEAHIIATLGGDTDLLHVDRHFIHDLHAGAFQRFSVSPVRGIL